MNKEYEKMVKATRKMMLKLTLEQEIELQEIYRGAIQDLSKQIEEEEEKTLTQLWLKDYRNAVIEVSNKLAKDLAEQIYEGTIKSAQYGTYADTKLFEVIRTEEGVNLPSETTQMFTSVPDEVLRTMIAGNIYRDGRGLSDRVWNCRNDFNESIDYVLKKGIAAKRSSFELAKDLEQFIKEPTKRPWDWGNVYPLMRGKQIDYNAQRLARTTITHAYREAQYKSAERNPFVTAVHWELSAEHYVRQVARWGEDECDIYAEQNWYGLGTGNFPADKAPLSHPQCLCYTYPIIPQSLDDITDELIAWGEGESNERLDYWYGLHFTEEIDYAKLGRELAFKVQEKVGRPERVIAEYIDYHENLLKALEVEHRARGFNEKRYNRVKRDIENATELFKGDYIIGGINERTRTIKYATKRGREMEFVCTFFEPDIYEERLDGMYYINFKSRTNKKEREEMLEILDKIFDKNKRAAGVKIQVNNTEIKKRNACYYRPYDDKIVIGTIDVLQSGWRGVATIAHEIGHRPYSMEFKEYEDLALSEEMIDEWKELAEKYYQKYRAEGEWMPVGRYRYPINAEDYYRDGNKEHFYSELWAEISSALTAPDYGKNKIEHAIKELEEYFPDLKEFVEKIYEL